MKYLLLLRLILISNSSLWSQIKTIENEKPYIEVNGTAEMDVTPDEIFIKIILKERQEGKTKITLTEQETNLKKAISSLGINLENLTLNDANADYSRIKWTSKDVVTRNEYVLKVSSADMVNKVYKKFAEIKVFDAYIYKISHSKIQEFRKEVRIKAIQLAKEKADYLLQAIGYQRGFPLVIREVVNNYISNNIVSNTTLSSNYREKNQRPSLQFQKLNIKISIYAKFEIIK